MGTHIDAGGAQYKRGRYAVVRFLKEDAALFVLAVCGLQAVWGRRVRRPSVLGLFSAWLVAGTLVLFFHRPVWSHHVLLLTVPAAVLAGAVLQTGKQKRHVRIVAVLVILIGARRS